MQLKYTNVNKKLKQRTINKTDIWKFFKYKSATRFYIIPLKIY